MAITPLVPGLSASILINGVPAPELTDPEPQIPSPTHPNPKVSAYQQAHTVTSYIKCTANTRFSILLTVEEPIRTEFAGIRRMKWAKLGFEITIDGNKVPTEKCTRPWFNKNPQKETWKCIVKGVKVGKGKSCFIREFEFLKVETSEFFLPEKKDEIGNRSVDSERIEKAEIERMRQCMQDIGIIEIKAYAENYGKKGGDMEDTTEDFLDEDQEEIHEKALKGEAKDHGTGLRRARKVARGEFWRTEKIDGEDYPLAIFKFIYRSEEALKQMLIIPRTPSPSPSPESDEEGEEQEDEEVDELTPAQKRVIQSLRKEMLKGNRTRNVASSSRSTPGRGTLGGNRVSKVKKEQTSDKLNPPRKSQQSTRRRKERGGKAVVIDLVTDSENEDDESLFAQQ
ncbi:uncharacterized protein LY89DRAFT_713091 [Mollisia scopiformis]|uniref:DUF7918 domain-containing protein n=1 Tax=Mollisia scopiformis TaxID=149040 RepID=A0A194XV34_MOLSC|nr:uncharacterized protein LY89DRAFT_713091 [Mollisia scopiformis]KUJ24185.1 hypothetical protein LY89DRAFT_713091 [Mollisia scopiformis]